MQAKEYQLMQMCVENGVRSGYTRARKHTDTPTDEQIIDAIESAVCNEICEWFTFNDSEAL